ncbi:Pkinase-domain-containing protein [Auriscalpium vulgare]|uniref:Pkinase-domain-containing protein n=1 Tax=Auriscalpium vulgare TaxID=40419 RepID=A0ACB8R559_9AGAM|nr:Pkinase-domain-containing protein [Auriscalpium vulgare]
MHAHFHARLPPPASSSAARRNPFASAINNPHQAGPQVPPKPIYQDRHAPASPPLQRQNAKVQPPSPPSIIIDKTRSVQFQRLNFLGEGGFARVYEVRDTHNNRLACKVVTKSSLKTKKAKTKLYAEIKIHRSLTHPNIVGFGDCFEDEENVYMTLALCPNGSLMDMLRRRRRFTEPEARFFTVQVIGACHYMHTHQVIHRDLKLGNIFLDADMNIQVGDFGLAALIENPGERKKTICGTPNYIAPEVLFDTANGHSFEVDTWSIGVILYTLVVGRPPFQTKDVKEIYQRIRDNQYEFPSDREISLEARELVKQILTPDPQQRPSLHEIIDHAFFTQGTVPRSIPVGALHGSPDFRHVSRLASQHNLARLRHSALLDEDQETQIAVPSAPPATAPAGSLPRSKSSSASVTSSLAQQEKEFQKAVQPGSPISALLSSARQPFLVAPGNGPREPSLLRKLQAVSKEAKSPVRTRLATLQNIEEEDVDREEEVRQKELQSQKARIVAQMVPSGSGHGVRDDAENVAPVERRVARVKEKTRIKEGTVAGPSAAPSGPKLNSFDAAAQTLSAAFEAFTAGRLFRPPLDDEHLPEEKVFIVSWVDYCNKYGMGYALTDGSVGVHFNDSTSIILSADKQHFDYISSHRQGTVYVRKSHTVASYPEELQGKVYLLKHFERYIMARLYGDYGYTFNDTDRTKGMDFVQKYLRMKHVIVFKMSHDVLQFNFYDHSKVILSSHGLVVTHIDKNYGITRWTLSQIMAQALLPPSTDSDQVKFNQRLVDKLKYCKEVLLSIRNASTGASQPGGEGDDEQIGMGMSAGFGGVSARSSKASLR